MEFGEYNATKKIARVRGTWPKLAPDHRSLIAQSLETVASSLACVTRMFLIDPMQFKVKVSESIFGARCGLRVIVVAIRLRSRTWKSSSQNFVWYG